ncbi:TIGR02147 family protein [bacterium]|nr:TIGR02147 family protein [bacterium]
MWQRYLVKKLQDHLEEARSKNPSFSLRSFAQKLQISPGALSEMLKENRKLGQKTASKIIRNLDLPNEEREKLKQMISEPVAPERILLPEEAYELASHWHYSALLGLFDLDSPPKNSEEAAALLKLDSETCDQAVQILIEFGFLKKENEVLFSTNQHFQTTEDIPSAAFRNALKEYSERSIQALEEIETDLREITSITFDGSSEGMEFAKKEIRIFRDRLRQAMQGAKRDTLYTLNIQLFPLTEPPKQPHQGDSH